MVEKDKTATTGVQESSFGLELLAWFETNKKTLIYVGIVILIAWIGTLTVIHFKREREAEASAALTSLRPQLGEPMLSNIPAQKYLEIYEKYRGTKTAPKALLLAAGAFFQEGKYQEAQKTFEKFLSEYPDDIFAAQAALGIASSLEAQGKEAEALTKYQEVTTRYSTDPSVLIPARMAYGRLMEKQGKYDAAYGAYADIIRSDAYTTWAQEAMYRIQALEKKHPELAQARIQQQQSSTPVSPKTNITLTVKTNVGPTK
ncbi:MAG TPA: tetratricopeptide repeat protein [Verrucomicrobiota bacterium]|nr:tetratricopeptide repeat protein [Verrucomicrobiota bacterium]